MLRIVACAEPARPDDAVEIALDQRDAGAFDRDVGAGAHGDADIGGGKRRRVVDAVAGHGDARALRAQLVDQRLLALRQHAGAHLVDAELPATARAVQLHCRRSP